MESSTSPRFRRNQEVAYCRSTGDLVTNARVTQVRLAEGTFFYDLEYDVGIPARPRTARQVPERHLEEMQQLDPEEGGGQLSEWHDRWLSELRKRAIVTSIYPEEDSCRVEYMARVEVEDGSSEHRLRIGLVRLSVLAEIQRRSGRIQEFLSSQSEAEVAGSWSMARAPQKMGRFEQSPETWPGPPVEMRAMRLRELQNLGRLIEACCEAGSWLDQRSGQLLKPGNVNLYNLNYFVICPCTVPEGVLLCCSGIDTRKAVPGQRVVQSDPNSRNADNVLAEGVIHGTRTVGGQDLLIVSPEAAVLDFIRCCEKHAQVRLLGEDSAYWICAYANRQHELGVDLGSDPMQSSFLKAMELSEGVLLMLDPEATPFSRVWCCFEEGVVALAERGALPGIASGGQKGDGREALRSLAARDGQEGRRSALQLDIATVDGNGTAQLITQRLTKQEEEMEESRKQASWRASGWDEKSERESGFPVELVRKGLRVKITEAGASQVSDKTQILNALAGRPIDELEAEPDYHHPILRQVDTTLRGIFAVAAWRATLEKDLVMSDGGNLPSELLEVALREDVSRQELELNLQGVATQHHLSALCKAVESLKKLTRLHLDLCECKITSIAELGNALAALTNLQKLSVDLQNCTGLTSIAELGYGLAALTILQELSINLAFCTSLTCIAEFGGSLGALTNLQELSVDFGGCTSLTSIAEMGRSLAALTNLHQLSVYLASCTGLTSIAELGYSMEALTNLQKLSVDLTYCTSLTCIAEFGRSLEALANLQKLSVNLAGCTGLTSIAEFWRSLEALTNLQMLSVVDCTRLTSITELGRSLGALTNLQQLSINLAFCTSLTCIAELGHSLEALTNLQELSVYLARCTSLTCIAELGRSLGALTNLQQLSVTLARCTSLTSIAELGRSLGALTNLQQLSVTLGGCRSLTSIAELGHSLEALTNLQKLSVDLTYCTSLTSIAELGRSLAALTNLQQLSVTLAYCTGLTCISELGRSLEALTNLQKLSVNLQECAGLTSIAELGSNLEALTNLKELFVDSTGCTGLPFHLQRILRRSDDDDSDDDSDDDNEDHNEDYNDD
ncbi:unnamed protein product [Polarella glacialis]|uniref:Uncharacterized protein n=1 Tax=Polarella glacialis TaxID=89957 RepID=A0A813L4Q5_POLGL|nr:unnamed protein product [Polarella glacialis]